MMRLIFLKKVMIFNQVNVSKFWPFSENLFFLLEKYLTTFQVKFPIEKRYFGNLLLYFTGHDLL